MAISHRQRIAAVRRNLLRWFARHKRDLPWRRTGDPYAIWVSEVMLQQTRVVAATDYYLRFLRRFPTAGALAAAPLDDVLKAWEGMGYYARARNLHRAARRLVAERGGALPPSAAELAALPGIGPYTAAAVASIAFGADEPVLDGNVVRVLCRLFHVDADPRAAATRRRLRRLAGRLLPPGRAGDFNQALMELGARVCTPAAPTCQTCPIRRVCRGRAAGAQRRLPRRTAAAPLPHHTVVVAVLRKRGRVLIDRRPDHGLLGGLWEFPGGKVQPGESHAQALRRELREEVGVEAEVRGRFAVVEHAYSHFRVTIHAYECRHVSGRARALAVAEVRWVRLGELDGYAMPRANRRILAALGGGQGT